MAKQQAAKTKKGEQSDRPNHKAPKKAPKTNRKTGRTTAGFTLDATQRRKAIRDSPFENLVKKVLDRK